MRIILDGAEKNNAGMPIKPLLQSETVVFYSKEAVEKYAASLIAAAEIVWPEAEPEKVSDNG